MIQKVEKGSMYQLLDKEGDVVMGIVESVTNREVILDSGQKFTIEYFVDEAEEVMGKESDSAIPGVQAASADTFHELVKVMTDKDGNPILPPVVGKVGGAMKGNPNIISELYKADADPVNIMLSKAKKKDVSISLNLTISVIDKALITIISDNFDLKIEDVVDRITSQISDNDIKRILKHIFMLYYTEKEPKRG